MAALPEEIIRLETRLASNPSDADGYYRLGQLYECLALDDAKAKRSYLMHFILTLGYPDVDAAFASLRRAAETDRMNAMTHLNLGHIYGYQDRFDEATEEFERGTVWKTFETAHFLLNAVPGSTAHEERETIARQREEALSRISDTFALDVAQLGPIVYYFYESRLHKAFRTGDQMPAHALVEKGEVHAVHGKKLRLNNPHEDAHIVLGHLGRPPKLLQEGAAEHVHHGRNVHERCVELCSSSSPRRFPTITELLDDHVFASNDPFQTYPRAASFVGYLMETYGPAAFKRLYGSVPAECSSRDFNEPESAAQSPFRRAYGKPLPDLEGDWRGFLARRMDESHGGRSGEFRR